MISAFIFWLILMVVVVVASNSCNRSPIVFGGIGLVFTPITALVALFVWHNYMDPRD